MSPKIIDEDTSLLPSNTSNGGQEPEGPGPTSTSPDENGKPDEDCEALRIKTVSHVTDYCEVRKSSHDKNNYTPSNETALNMFAEHIGLSPAVSNEISRRQGIPRAVTFDLAQSAIIILAYTLEQMIPKACSRALNANLVFLATAMVTSLVANDARALDKYPVVNFMYLACIVTGSRGAYCFLYWSAAKHCFRNVQKVRHRLNNGTLRHNHIGYLEGLPWSFLRSANS